MMRTLINTFFFSLFVLSVGVCFAQKNTPQSDTQKAAKTTDDISKPILFTKQSDQDSIVVEEEPTVSSFYAYGQLLELGGVMGEMAFPEPSKKPSKKIKIKNR